MNTMHKGVKGIFGYIGGWIMDLLGCLLLVMGGLFVVAGIFLLVTSIIDPPTGGEGLFFVMNIGFSVVLLLIGPLLLFIGTKIIKRKNV